MTKKILLPLAMLCVTISAWTFYSVSQKANTVNSLHTTSNSISICFERAGQSFMAVMLKDFGNSYVGNDFLTTTKDCFEELKDQLEGIQANWKPALKKFNYLLTDYHWFAEEVQKSAVNDGNLISNEVIENVMSYYQKVEGHKNTLVDLLEKRENSLATTVFSKVLFFTSLFVLFILSLFSSRKDETATVVNANQGRDRNELAAQMDQATKGSKPVQNDEVNFNLDQLSTPEMYKNMESLNLNLVATGVAAVLGNKAFAHGVMMDFDVSEELYVKGQEDNVNQLLYSLTIYLMDALKGKDGQRKISIHAKEVKQNIEVMIKADGLRFNKKELNYINLRSQNQEDKMAGELNICREIIEMSDISLKLVNGMVDSEGYAKFIIRMRKGAPKKLFIDSRSRKLVNLERGTKSEVQARLQ